MFRAQQTVPAASLQPPARPPPPAGPLPASPRPSPEPWPPPPSAARRPARGIGVSGACELAAAAAVAAATVAAIFFLHSLWRAAASLAAEGSVVRGTAPGSMRPGRAAGERERCRGSGRGPGRSGPGAAAGGGSAAEPRGGGRGARCPPSARCPAARPGPLLQARCPECAGAARPALAPPARPLFSSMSSAYLWSPGHSLTVPKALGQGARGSFTTGIVWCSTKNAGTYKPWEDYCLDHKVSCMTLGR
ncbi:transcription initiation factor TFIID subunit 4-like [Elephas maximus indicus]|uniref:transcription initiation factor TFIID subunit 4-like n=1 Tax=Elephas maximus indicus TaxID=99487 RepID=UPI002116EAEE|nr:transcription initiation factor TFIID subunit 4-like [Elephas maximus indicus]